MQRFLSDQDRTKRLRWLEDQIEDPRTDVLDRLFMIQEKLNIEDYFKGLNDDR